MKTQSEIPTTQGFVVLQALGSFLQQPELLQEWHERLKGVADLEGLHGALLGLEACLAKAGESQNAGTHTYIAVSSWSLLGLAAVIHLRAVVRRGSLHGKGSTQPACRHALPHGPHAACFSKSV